VTALDVSDSPSGTLDGDVSAHLEDLVVGSLAELEAPAKGVRVEMVGPHLRLAATVNIGHFRRLSDFFNHRDGLLALSDAIVLRRNGDATKVVTPSIWLSPDDLTLVAQMEDLRDEGTADDGPSPDFAMVKVAVGMIFVTPGHTLTGNVFIPDGAELAAFIESPVPPFIPMTDVRTRSLADRRVTSRYPFVLLNRRHVVAATPLLPGMATGRSAI
jgi:hypothetical protein